MEDNRKKLEALLMEYIEKEIKYPAGGEPVAILPAMIDRLFELWIKF